MFRFASGSDIISQKKVSGLPSCREKSVGSRPRRQLPVKIIFFSKKRKCKKLHDFMWILRFFLILELGRGLAEEKTVAKSLLSIFLYNKMFLFSLYTSRTSLSWSSWHTPPPLAHRYQAAKWCGPHLLPSHFYAISFHPMVAHWDTSSHVATDIFTTNTPYGQVLQLVLAYMQ